MAGGGFAASSGGGGTEFEAKITPIVIISCIMAATGGLMFGYDVGVSGGVTSMGPFLEKFFPVVYRRTQDPGLESNYCKYDNQGLQLFTSSLYLAGLTATFFASYTTRRLGRRLTMLIAGLFFIVGVILNAAAQDLAMLIIGRILLGCGVGFANQAVPLFLSEIAPTRIRGGLNILFQLNVTIGILFANLVNYGTAKRMGLESVTGAGRGKAVLKRIRGTDNVEPEFLELVEASRVAKQVKHPFRNLLMRRNRPQLIIALALQVQSMYYRPSSQSIRRQSGTTKAPSRSRHPNVPIPSGHSHNPRNQGDGSLGQPQPRLRHFRRDPDMHVRVRVRLVVGPARVAHPERDVPLETLGSAGQSVTVCVNLLFTFVIAQAFLSMLCHFKFGIFLFFLRVGVVDVVFRVFLAARDEERADRGDDGAGLEEALAVEEVYG
ncbi:hypothetical protein DH2020_027181 [Rehmannia glutinosa]|uniref:Major facilitator superfamily (MFS) profile domain-containing protein n=1 Tax=Rehmannia glutinosa TaxID=99300 RepID=A0ABR0VUS3_REHGL